MLTENTISKLREIRLGTMAEAFREQLTNPEISSLSFEDRFGLLVDAEWTTRKNNTLARMIKKAQFADPSACIENISYLPQRNLDKAQIARFAECVYIHEHHNILLMGATGCGKTYLACALGMAAVRKSYQVRYVRLPELLTDLAIARTTGTYSKVIEQYKKARAADPRRMAFVQARGIAGAGFVGNRRRQIRKVQLSFVLNLA